MQQNIYMYMWGKNAEKVKRTNDIVFHNLNYLSLKADNSSSYNFNDSEIIKTLHNGT
jgi:hypothetical protein